MMPTSSDGTPREPTSAECSAGAAITHDFGRGPETVFAGWYPQMGGYVGRAVVRPLGGCFDVWVWHDGEFPFSETDGTPAHLHHCMVEQFVQFGEWVASLPGMMEYDD